MNDAKINNSNSKNGENNSQRYTPYRAVIPFYILFDLDLNANHLRMYGQIEQMESNPDPQVCPSFSYQWLANQLGINKRNTINIARLLVEKKYIEHIQTKSGKWVWRTVKAQVVIDDTNCTDSNSVAERHPPVSHRDTPPVSLSDTQRSHKIRSQKNKKEKENYIKEKEQNSPCPEKPEAVRSKAIKQQPLENTYPDTYYQSTELQPVNNQSTEITEYEEDAFEAFWSLYPVKKGKARAKAQWFHDGCQNRSHEIIEKLQEQIEKDKHFLDGYAPNPHKYITEKRFEDEIFQPKAVYDHSDTSWINKRDIFDD